MTSSDTLPLNEDQQALQDTLRGFLAGQLPAATLRAALETRTGYSPELHARLASEFGLAGLTIPGSSAAGPVPGRGERGAQRTRPCPVSGPAPGHGLAGGMLLATDDRAATERWLPLLADGSVIATVAAADEAGHWVFGPDSVRAERAPGGWRLYGHRWYVLAAHAADIVAVPAMTESGPAMFLVDPRSLGYTVSGQLGLDLTRRVCVTAFDEAPARPIGRGEIAAVSPGTGRTGLPARYRGRGRRRHRLVPGHGHRLRQGPRAVRAADRLLPGGRARLRRHAGRLPGRLCGRQARRPSGRGRRRPRPRRRPTPPRCGRARPTAP